MTLEVGGPARRERGRRRYPRGRRCPSRVTACSGSPAHSRRVQPRCRRCVRDVEQAGAPHARCPQSGDPSLCRPWHLVIVTVRVALRDSRHATGVAGDTAFSPESGESGDSFWQGIADGHRRPHLSADLTLVHSQGTARAMGPPSRALPCPAAVCTPAPPPGVPQLTEGLPCQSTGGGVPAGGARPSGRVSSCR